MPPKDYAEKGVSKYFRSWKLVWRKLCFRESLCPSEVRQSINSFRVVMLERMILVMPIRPVCTNPDSSKGEALCLAGCLVLAAAQHGGLLVTQCSFISLKCTRHSSHHLWAPSQVSISTVPNGGWWEDRCTWTSSSCSKLKIYYDKRTIFNSSRCSEVHLLLHDTGSVCVPNSRKLNSPYYWKYFLSKGFQYFRIWKDQ